MSINLSRLGRTNIEVTKITFGAWVIGGWNWGGTDEAAAIDAVKAAIDTGMTTIDTAPIYGFGLSEELIGKALKNIPRDRYQILTKYGLVWEGNDGKLHANTTDLSGNPITIYRYAAKNSIIKECESSLKRLNTDYIDLYQIHWPDPSTPIEETMEAMQILIDQGKIRAAGVCNFSSGQIDEALKYHSLASNQVPYSMIRRGIEKKIQPQALEKGLSILPYSPLQRGLLTGKIRPGYSFSKGDNRAGLTYFTPGNIQKVQAMLDKIRPIANDHQVSLAQLVLNWTSRQPAISTVLAGARNAAQVRDNAQALSFELTDEELKLIQNAIESYDGELDE